MGLPYFVGQVMRLVEVNYPCPGCGKANELSVRSKVNSFVHHHTEYYIGCNCGWMGPVADKPLIAAVKWDCRSIIKELSEAKQ